MVARKYKSYAFLADIVEIMLYAQNPGYEEFPEMESRS